MESPSRAARAARTSRANATPSPAPTRTPRSSCALSVVGTAHTKKFVCTVCGRYSHTKEWVCRTKNEHAACKLFSDELSQCWDDPCEKSPPNYQGEIKTGSLVAEVHSCQISSAWSYSRIHCFAHLNAKDSLDFWNPRQQFSTSNI